MSGWLCSDCRAIHKRGQRCPKKVSKYKDERDRKFLNSKLWQTTRLNVKVRDGGLCVRCMIKYNRYNDKDLQVHHIIPRTKIWKSGRLELLTDERNLVTVCGECNRELGEDGRLDFKYDCKEIPPTL